MEQLLKGLVSFDIAHEAIVRCLANLWLLIAQILDHLFQELASDVILDLTWVQVDDLQGQCACEEVDIFLVYHTSVP